MNKLKLLTALSSLSLLGVTFGMSDSAQGMAAAKLRQARAHAQAQARAAEQGAAAAGQPRQVVRDTTPREGAAAQARAAAGRGAAAAEAELELLTRARETVEADIAVLQERLDGIWERIREIAPPPAPEDERYESDDE